MSLIAIRMPKWGLSMKEGTITAWHVAPGHYVERGAELCDIETAKITNAFEAPASGLLARRLAESGAVVGVGRLIAVLATAGEDAGEIDALLRSEQQEAAGRVAEQGSGLQTIPTSAGPVAYAEEGGGNPATVVLLHGFGGDHAGWMFVQSALAASFRVIAFDMPGHGASTRVVGDGSAAAIAAPLAEAMAALCPGPVHLVAHSLGATASLIAPAGFGAPVDLSYVRGFVAARRKRDLRPLLERLFARPETLSRAMVAAGLALLEDEDARDALARIAARIEQDGPGVPGWPGPGRWQVLWGGHDRIVPLTREVEHTLAAHLHRLPGSGHMPQLEEHERVNSLLLTHLMG